MNKNAPAEAGTDGGSASFTDGEPMRVAVLHLALERSGAATSALVEMSAALTDARVPGLAWDIDYLTDRVAAVAGEIALLASTESGPVARADRGLDEHDALATEWDDALGRRG